MKLFCTRIWAVDPRDNVLKTWSGPLVPGLSFETAQQYCDQHGLGYCEIIGEFENHVDAHGRGVDLLQDFARQQLN